MAITTLAELTTAILDWSTRSILAANVPDFITLTEGIINYGDGKPGADDYIAPLRTREMITLGATVTISSGLGTLPADFLEAIRLYTSLKTLQFAPAGWYSENYPSGQSTVPQFYALLGSTLYSGASVTFDYYTKVGPLATAVNWLLTKAPNAYLHGGLYHLYLFDKDGEKAAIHRSLMANAIAGLQGTDMTSIIVSPQRRASMVAW